MTSTPRNLLLPSEAPFNWEEIFNGEFEPVDEDQCEDVPVVVQCHAEHTYAAEVPRGRQVGPGLRADHKYSMNPRPALVTSDNSCSPKSDPCGYLDKDFDLEAILRNIKKLKKNKAKGLDAIPNEAIMNAPQ